jgi:hypothetical protein
MRLAVVDTSCCQDLARLRARSVVISITVNFHIDSGVCIVYAKRRRLSLLSTPAIIRLIEWTIHLPEQLFMRPDTMYALVQNCSHETS